MIVARTIADMRRAVAGLRAQGRAIGLAPTMGALHAGHLNLLNAAKARGDAPLATLFVNPTQFGPNEDFAAYPRGEAHDFARLEEAGCPALFAPSLAEMLPEPPLTSVHVAGLTDGLCGPFRPGHFDGVATVVTKLFAICTPDRAYFGEKDYQQLQVVKRLAGDLMMPVEIVPVPTTREADGLALSSRNAYLTKEQRAIAAALPRALFQGAREAEGGAPPAEVCARATHALLAAGFASVDYVELVDAATLQAVARIGAPARLIAAARLGRTRLIDNVAVRV